jgi:ABC-type sulfate/molybdate transport systems ATPase subunit
MEFYVEIKKKFNGFQLDVKLQSQEEIIGILGASGSGKSMLLRCIAGLVKPDEGKIIINGKTFFDSDKKINLSMRERRVGFLFQNYALFPNMTVESNISFGLDKLPIAEKESKVAKLVKKYSLSGLEKRYPTQISGGQQQRVALARAVAVDPDILLLDEPFSALDVHLRNLMMREMAESLKEFKGMTLFVTHNRDEAYQLCDHIAIFNVGKVEVFGQKDAIFKWPASLETAKITGCKNIVKATRISDNQLDVAEWGITLRTEMKIEHNTGYMGVRANQVKLIDVQDCLEENCFKVWIADESDGPFRTSLYLKIGSKPKSLDDFHIQCEISREERNHLCDLTEPFVIYINPNYVFFVNQ